ncbi:MAG: hypothetical protein C0424_11955 [Sphingobacteriaceae bacterium]|nr:hypothetical protein [Sphingobacteriaceae bacterium]
MKRVGTLGALLIGVFLGIACKKDNPVPKLPPFFNVPPGLASYFVFYPGSFWTLVDLDREWTDSIYIKSVLRDTIALLHPGNPRDTLTVTERITVRYYSPFFDSDYIFRSALDIQAWVRNPQGPHFMIQRAVVNAGRQRPFGTVFYYPLPVNRPFITEVGSFSPFIQEPLAPFLQRNGVLLPQASRVNVENDVSEFGNHMEHFFVAGWGPVSRGYTLLNYQWLLRRGRTINAAGDTLHFP